MITNPIYAQLHAMQENVEYMIFTLSNQTFKNKKKLKKKKKILKKLNKVKKGIISDLEEVEMLVESFDEIENEDENGFDDEDEDEDEDDEDDWWMIGGKRKLDLF